MTDKIDPKFKELILAKIPSNRLGKPEDIANAVIFLISDDANYINGETIHINGGLYLGWQKNNLIYEQNYKQKGLICLMIFQVK